MYLGGDLLKKTDIIIIFFVTLISTTVSGIILHYAFLKPERYTGGVSIEGAPESIELIEDLYYNFEIAAWGEPRDIYQIRIRWWDSSENIDVIAGSENEVLTSRTKDFRVEVKSLSEAPPQLNGIFSVVELLDPEDRLIAMDFRWIRIVRQ